MTRARHSHYESLQRFFAPTHFTPQGWAELQDLAERCRDVGDGNWRDTSRAIAHAVAPHLFRLFVSKHKLMRGREAGFAEYLSSIKAKGIPRFPNGLDRGNRAWVDHGMICYGARERFFISQPYGLSDDAMAGLVSDCSEYGLSFHIESGLSFHFPGSTILIEVRRNRRAS